MKNKILISIVAGTMIFSSVACTNNNKDNKTSKIEIKENLDAETSADKKNEEVEIAKTDDTEKVDVDIVDDTKEEPTEENIEIEKASENKDLDFKEKYAKELDEIKYIYKLEDELNNKVDANLKWPYYGHTDSEGREEIYVVVGEAGNVRTAKKLDEQIKAFAEANKIDYVDSDVYYKDGKFIYGIRYRGEVGAFEDFKTFNDFIYSDEDLLCLEDMQDDADIMEKVAWETKTNASGSDDFTVISFAAKDKDFAKKTIETIQKELEKDGVKAKFISMDKTVNGHYFVDVFYDQNVSR